jgi:hypothetical protein
MASAAFEYADDLVHVSMSYKAQLSCTCCFGWLMPMHIHTGLGFVPDIHSHTHTHILAEEWQPRVTMVTWETCLEHALPWQLYDRLTPPFATSKQSAVLKKACTAYENLVRYNVSNKNMTESVFCPCDLVSLAYFFVFFLIPSCLCVSLYVRPLPSAHLSATCM